MIRTGHVFDVSSRTLHLEGGRAQFVGETPLVDLEADPEELAAGIHFHAVLSGWIDPNEQIAVFN